MTPDTRKYLICQIQQPKRSEAAAAPCPQVQPVSRLKMFSQKEHIHSSNTYTPYIRTYIWLDIQILDRHSDHSYLILLLDLAKQGKCPLMEIYLCIQGEFHQQLGSETQSAQQPPSLPSCCTWTLSALRVAAPLQLLVQSITHTARSVQDSRVSYSLPSVWRY